MLYDVVFFFNDTATTEIYTLSLHDALPIYVPVGRVQVGVGGRAAPVHRVQVEGRGVEVGQCVRVGLLLGHGCGIRSEEHTSELQSRQYRMPSSACKKKRSLLPLLLDPLLPT